MKTVFHICGPQAEDVGEVVRSFVGRRSRVAAEVIVTGQALIDDPDIGLVVLFRSDRDPASPASDEILRVARERSLGTVTMQIADNDPHRLEVAIAGETLVHEVDLGISEWFIALARAVAETVDDDQTFLLELVKGIASPLVALNEERARNTGRAAFREFVQRLRDAPDTVARVAVVLAACREIEVRIEARVEELKAHFRRHAAQGHGPVSATGAERELDAMRGEIRPMLEAAAAFPDTADALLDAAELARWRGFLIVRYARWPALRPAMLARAHARRQDGDMISDLIALAEKLQDRALLVAAQEILWPPGRPADSDGQNVIHDLAEKRLMWTSLKLGDRVAAERIAVGAITRRGDVEALLQLLHKPDAPVPDGAMEALIALEGSQRTRMPAELRRIGRAQFADTLQARLVAAGRGHPSWT